MPNTTVIDRNQVSSVIDEICKSPTFIFSVTCERRTDLYLRYDPRDRFTNGPLTFAGDASRLADHEQVRFCECGTELPSTSRKCKECGAKREKIILEAAGTLRRMIVKGKHDDQPMKHWKSKGGELAFNPAEKGLKLVAGMYQDRPSNQGCGKRIGRHGQWRSWAFICLHTVQTIKWMQQTFLVEGQLATA